MTETAWPAPTTGGFAHRSPGAPVVRPVPSPVAPARLGYRMPAEFERHHRLWFAWPGATTRSWADPSILGDLESLARAARRFEPVCVAVAPAYRAEAAERLGSDIELLETAVDDIWIRDSGPTFLVGADGGRAATTWNFNIWGGKFDGHAADQALAPIVAAAAEATAFRAPIITEGGALHVDGEGTVVVTESAVLNDNRNPGLTRAEIEAGLDGWLGTDTVIWIPGERRDSITDGHIDGLMTFIRPGAALFEVSDDTAHPRYHLLREQARALELATDARGRRIAVTRLVSPRELPHATADFCGRYVNCLLLNGAVLIPAFGDRRADASALATFAAAFPGREVVQLRVDAICAGGGGIHCVTQQEPAVRRPPAREPTGA